METIIDTKDVLIIAVVLLFLICLVLARAVCRLTRDQIDHSEWEDALEAEIERAGWMGQYRDAHKAAHLAEWHRRNAARLKAEAEAQAQAKAKVEAEDRASRGRAIAAEAKATPEAQAKRKARAVKAAN